MRNVRRAWFGATKRASFVWGYAKAAVVMRAVAESAGRLPLFIGRTPKLIIRGAFTVGDNFRMRSSVVRSLIEVSDGGRLEIGDHVFINQGAVIAATDRISIGDRVDIGDAVRIYDSNFHPVKPGGQTKVAVVVIESDVWIASGATILPGVQIGRASVIAAGATVTKSVPSGSIVAGNPAQVIGTFEVPADYRRRGPEMSDAHPAVPASVTAQQ